MLVMAGEVVTFLLRLPPQLHAALTRVARKEMRSLHAQIIYFLRRGVIDAGEDPGD